MQPEARTILYSYGNSELLDQLRCLVKHHPEKEDKHGENKKTYTN